MVGAEKDNQYQRHEAPLAAKGDPRDAARSGHMTRNLPPVSVLRYRGPSLLNSITQNGQANRCVVESVGALLNA